MAAPVDIFTVEDAVVADDQVALNPEHDSNRDQAGDVVAEPSRGQNDADQREDGRQAAIAGARCTTMFQNGALNSCWLLV